MDFENRCLRFDDYHIEEKRAIRLITIIAALVILVCIGLLFE